MVSPPDPRNLGTTDLCYDTQVCGTCMTLRDCLCHFCLAIQVILPHIHFSADEISALQDPETMQEAHAMRLSHEACFQVAAASDSQEVHVSKTQLYRKHFSTYRLWKPGCKMQHSWHMQSCIARDVIGCTLFNCLWDSMCAKTTVPAMP